MFWLRNKKNNFQLCTLIWGPELVCYIIQHYKEVYERLEFVHKKVFPDAHRRRWKQADWTDETDQMILVLQSIIHNKALVSIQKILLRSIMAQLVV